MATTRPNAAQPGVWAHLLPGLHHQHVGAGAEGGRRQEDADVPGLPGADQGAQGRRGEAVEELRANWLRRSPCLCLSAVCALIIRSYVWRVVRETEDRNTEAP